MNRDRVSVLGIQIDNVSIHQAVARVTAMVDAGGTHQVATANSDFVTNALEDESVRNILTNCDLVVPDGMPLVWISRLLGTPLKERVAGVDLIHQLARESAHRGDRIFLLGSSEANLVASTRKLRTLYPEIQICGYYSPPQSSIFDGSSFDRSTFDRSTTKSLASSWPEAKQDLFKILDFASDEVPGLLQALREGKVNGSVYEGECACLVGTIANLRHCHYKELQPDMDRPAERWFLGIRKGDIPESNPVVGITCEWIEEWRKAHAEELAK